MSAELLAALKRYWGYDGFRPLQREAMENVLQGQDSVVVLPTGGGKSLCFQVPAVCMDGMAIVVSPLIALMKDQVDTLRENGVPAAYINSSLPPEARRQVSAEILSGQLKLLYVAPERLLLSGTIEFLQRSTVSMIAVDEAHCISEWGHDFRPEYRALAQLKAHFPGVGVHAFTATATERVRDDIAQQLGLDHPKVLVGSFDRPNLIYRVARRGKILDQIESVIARHPGESGVIYCPTRAEVESTAEALKKKKYKAVAYHAGLTDKQRQRSQDHFLTDRADIVVATVAFGMGIDKSNVRYVIHTAMPKSVEAYQQESGRAGRDGLEAECWLFHSGSDLMRWRRMIEAGEAAATEAALRSLDDVGRFCASAVCRHRFLSRYFGQELEGDSCGACDICLGEADLVDDPLVLGQKILSSVIRQRERFGGEYTAMVLKGSHDARILRNGHQSLSTFGLLAQEEIRTIRDWIEQLVDQGFLAKTGEYNVLSVTDAGRRLLKGEGEPRLLRPTSTSTGRPSSRRSAKKGKPQVDEWEVVDSELFESLRQLRKEQAQEAGVPPYIVFGDAALREMARVKPTTIAQLLTVKGVGEKKASVYGQTFLEAISQYRSQHRDH